MVMTEPFRIHRISPSRTLATALLVISVGFATACGDSYRSTVADPIPSSTIATEVFPRCIRGTENSDEMRVHDLLQEYFDLEQGECVFIVDLATNRRKPDRTLAEITLSIWKSRSVEDLRPTATRIAHVLKAAQISPPIHDLVVTNMGAYRSGSKPRGYQEFLRDRKFEQHPWDGAIGPDAEFAQWEVDTKAD